MAVVILGPDGVEPAIVCLHGLSANRSTWQPVARSMASRHRLVLVDLLGRGESDPAPAAAYDLESEAARLATLLDGLGIRQPVLAGHSHGAAVAVAAARRVQARGLVLVNPVTPELMRPAILSALWIPGVSSTVSVAARLFRRRLTRYMLVRRVFASADSVPPGAIDRYASPWADPKRAAVLPRILRDWRPAELERWATPPGIPVAVIAGDVDRRIDAQLAQRWAERLEATFSLTCSGHSSPEECPEDVRRALEEILDTTRTTGTGRDTE